MIELSKTSWHYRAARFASLDVPRSLCPYMRQVVVGACIWAFIVTLLSSIAVADLFAIVGVLLGGGIMTLPKFVIASASVTLGIGGGIGILWLKDKYDEWASARRYKKWDEEYERKYGKNAKDYVPPQPNIITLYWRAIHDKLCPMIEFKGAEEKGGIEPEEPWPEDDEDEEFDEPSPPIRSNLL